MDIIPVITSSSPCFFFWQKQKTATTTSCYSVTTVASVAYKLTLSQSLSSDNSMITYGHVAILPNPFSYLSHSAHRLRFSQLGSPTLNRRTRTVASCLSLTDDRIIVGCGGASIDYLVMVDSFPNPDDKIRSTSYKVQGGGNVGNALTCAARLGLKPRIITKVAADSEGKRLVEELNADGVDTSFVVVSKDGRSMFSYVIVESEMKTRTAIYHPGYPPMTPDDISNSTLSAVLDGAKLVYFDGLSLNTALAVAKEASRKSIPILVDAEMGEEGFENLLDMASYAVCSAKYPQAWTNALTMPSALITMLLRLPNLKFVIVTLGEDGCIMLERSQIEDPALKTEDVDLCFDSLRQIVRGSKINPACASSAVLKLRADGVGELKGRLFVGTAESIPHSELVDTTGAGDAFIGAVLYALCTGMPAEKMLPFASQVAGDCCKALGARTGLPRPTDQQLESFFHPV